MRIKEYPIAKNLGDNDVLVIETDEGTKQMPVKSLAGQVSGSTTSDTIDAIIKSSDFSKIIDKIYPVGSLYISYNSKSPASIFGGSWVQITDKFLRAANDTNTGGSDEITLTTAQMPEHRHMTYAPFYFWRWGDTTANDKSMVRLSVASVGYGVLAVAFNGKTTANYFYTYQVQSTTDPASTQGSRYINNTGSSESINQMPAYQDVYVWRRIS